jgi:hypothetical protein
MPTFLVEMILHLFGHAVAPEKLNEPFYWDDDHFLRSFVLNLVGFIVVVTVVCIIIAVIVG